MAKLFYKSKNGDTELHVTNDDQVLLVSDLQSQLAGLQVFADLADDARTLLAQGGVPSVGIPGGLPDLAAFDDFVGDEVDRLRDILDYPGYGNTVVNTTVQEGAWFLPVALESVSDENVGEEGPLSIDGNNGTWWQSDLVGTRTWVGRLRDYRKKIERIRLRTTSGDLRAQLQGVDIRVANTIPNLDNAENLVDSAVDFTYVADNWLEHTFTTGSKLGKYIKLEIPGSLHATDVRIREVQAWVGITNHDK